MNAPSPKVLIVEDDAIVQLHLRVLLEELGYAVVGIAANGDDALIGAGANPPDLVIMDIRLKGKRDGIETAAILGIVTIPPWCSSRRTRTKTASTARWRREPKATW